MQIQTEEGLVPAKRQIRILDLFCMGAGLTYNIHTPNLKKAREATGGRCPTVETMNYLAKDPLVFEPSTSYKYSLCHDVLAAVVEIISGMPFTDYVKKNIFDPLGMANSTFYLDESEWDIVAEQYKFDKELGHVVNVGKDIQITKIGSEYVSGGGGCISTTEDYILFLEAMRKGDVLLKKETTDLMTTNHLNGGQLKNFGHLGKGYGYGLGVRCPLGNSGVTDFGWSGAGGAYLAIDCVHNITLFYVQHVLAAPNRGFRPRIFEYAQKALA